LLAKTTSKRKTISSITNEIKTKYNLKIAYKERHYFNLPVYKNIIYKSSTPRRELNEISV